jgi:hypothetical protein
MIGSKMNVIGALLTTLLGKIGGPDRAPHPNEHNGGIDSGIFCHH